MVNTTGVEPEQSGARGGGLPLASLNHISVVCRSLESSLSFYRNVLGFIPIRRPGSFDFDGAWLFNYGIGIHLLQAEHPESTAPKKTEINPKDNHISFQCESIEAVQRRLKEMGVKYVQRRVEEGGIYVDQLFFHDPDGFMIEVCTCDNLPIVPLVPEGHAVLGLPPAAPACNRAVKPPPKALQSQQQQLPVPVAVLPPSPPLQCVPTKTNGGSCVGEVEAGIHACEMRPCPEHACMQSVIRRDQDGTPAF
ncbi:glyoxylase I 4-like [Phragmites australis]|uniref:glyoxylase I 4-like n=1 Tax=Phragmites australis TaxID=29695 RepID=UPI002D768315|nr:glyoxylase I 4-like [Phragmites australis]